MQVFLGLGSNLGDRRDHLARAIDALEARGIGIDRVSPVVESPALLPDSAPSDWNLPFLNLVLECTAECSPEQLRLWIDDIQSASGRVNSSHWSPRPIDIDILLWGRERIVTERLTIPHRDLTRRSFVLAPLIALAPRLTVPGGDERTMLEHSIALGHHIPLWMGIVNVTPDSFSDGGRFMDWPRIEPHVEAMIDAGVHVIDMGGESTRPGAAEVDPELEWSRVEPVDRATGGALGREPAQTTAEPRYPPCRGGRQGPRVGGGHRQRRERPDLARHDRACAGRGLRLGRDAPRHDSRRSKDHVAGRRGSLRCGRGVAVEADGGLGCRGSGSGAHHLRPRDRLRQESPAVPAPPPAGGRVSGVTGCGCWSDTRASPS